MRLVLEILLFVPAVPLMVWNVYLALLGLAASLGYSRRFDGIDTDPPHHDPLMFLTVIPAHNEENQIGKVAANVLMRLEEDGFAQRVVVIADNCADKTADAARQAGAEVIERVNPEERGKGYALRYAQDYLMKRTDWNVMVVVDADSELSAGFFKALQQAFARGANAVQGYYSALRPGRHWRARLLEVAWSVFNYLRPFGRTCIGATSGLFGNGFALSRASLQEVPFTSQSIAEDVEHCLYLLEKGICVRFAPGAVVRARVEEHESSARTQRVRWESGRFTLAGKWIPRLLSRQDITIRAYLRHLEAALDLSLPPLIVYAGMIAIMFVFSLIIGFYLLTGICLCMLIALVFIIVEGVLLAGVPLSHLASVIWAPWYLLWKILLYLKPSFWKQTTWIRTDRDSH
ncbi:MAG: glycosyltransferase family 2 protein [bacterium]|nr:glycosyltransferase family 2 protein [Candidatus Sumerlaeota bacterium]